MRGCYSFWLVLTYACVRRVTAGCNAWFMCTDGGDCKHEGRAVEYGKCLLLDADARPRREPALEDITAPGSFFSFQEGRLKGEPCMLWLESAARVKRHRKPRHRLH
jgi:hypothetical protein